MTVGVAVVGLGYWGPNLARNMASTDGARLEVLCDFDRERLDRIGSQFPAARRVTDYDVVVRDPGIDAVVLATPVATHFQLASEALRAGKHVLVEKPLATSIEECEELIGLADAGGLRLMVGHVFLFNPAVRWIKEYIAAGSLGQVYYVYSQRLNLGQVRHDVNALWNFAPHDLSILGYWLEAEPMDVTARGFSYLQDGIEDVVFLTMRYPGGVGANVHISWLDPLKVRRMTIVGSEKMLVYDDVSADAKVTIFDHGVTKKMLDTPGASLGGFRTYGEFQLLLRAGDVLIPKLEFSEPLAAECRHFIESIESGTQPLANGREGLRVVRALAAAQRSLDQTA